LLGKIGDEWIHGMLADSKRGRLFKTPDNNKITYLDIPWVGMAHGKILGATLPRPFCGNALLRVYRIWLLYRGGAAERMAELTAEKTRYGITTKKCSNA